MAARIGFALGGLAVDHVGMKHLLTLGSNPSPAEIAADRLGRLAAMALGNLPRAEGCAAPVRSRLISQHLLEAETNLSKARQLASLSFLALPVRTPTLGSRLYALLRGQRIS